MPLPATLRISLGIGTILGPFFYSLVNLLDTRVFSFSHIFEVQGLRYPVLLAGLYGEVPQSE